MTDDPDTRQADIDRLRATLDALAQRHFDQAFDQAYDRAMSLPKRDALSQIERDVTILMYMVSVLLVLTILTAIVLLYVHTQIDARLP